MKSENPSLPIQKAREPDEEAHQPQCDNNMSPPSGSQKERNNVSFAEGTRCNEQSTSQNSAYKDVLSQPPPTLTHRQRMQWLQKRRSTGLWANCDDCGSWRYLPHVLDSHELPSKWYCRLNPDKTASQCSDPEIPIRLRDEEDLIHGEYSAGSVVWARLPGWPWWPAMVDDCPDTEQFYWLDGFSDIPTHYNVVFFDAFDASRAWIAPEKLQPYTANKKNLMHLLTDKRYKKRLSVAVTQADDADCLPLANRLAKYSFINRYPGAINHPRKIDKEDLKKFQNKLQRKYDIAFPDENAESSNVEPLVRNESKRNNVILLGTPKRPKTVAKTCDDEIDEVNGEVSIEKAKEDTQVPNAKQGQEGKLAQNSKKAKEDKLVPNFKKTKEDKLVPNFKKAQEDKLAPNSKKAKEDKQVPKSKEVVDSKDIVASDSDVVAMSKEIETESANEVFKQPNSLAVQVGSSATPVAFVDGSFDNDTSKTYVPGSESDTESMSDTVQKISVRVASPSSDDFDF